MLFRSISLAEVRDFVERSFRPVAEQKGLEFTIRADEDTVPASLRTDSQRLEQILKNLLSNAFKFTEKGSVSLSIALAGPGVSFSSETLQHAPSVLAFAVSDTGIGIPHTKQRIIFEAFQQADGTTSRRYGGTGLGLSISREIARLLGGELHVISTPNEGSTFTLYLPETCAEYAGAADESSDTVLPEVPDPLTSPTLSRPAGPPRSSVPSKTAPRVLIIDDDVRNIFALSSALEGKGLQVVYAENGKAGLEMLASSSDIGLVLVDVMMPEMDGYETIRAIRNDLQLRSLPILAVTAKALNEDREKCMSAGASDYLPKPVDVDSLGEHIAFWMHDR